jgi:uncharacterized membrane protein
MLILSLAFNVLVIAAIGTAAYRFRQHGPWFEHRPGLDLVGFLVSLPRDRREALLGTAVEYRQQLRPARAAVRQARQDLRAALLAEPFDPARYDELQQRFLKSEQDLRQITGRLVAQVVSTMSASERALLARWEGRRGDGWRRRRGPDETP